MLRFILICSLFVALPSALAAEEITIEVNTRTTTPAWAVLERQLLDANTAACQKFFERYFDDRGYLQCVERWGGDDGPDDAIECMDDWPVLHALGASDSILSLYKCAWEGHLRQYTAARTKEVPLAREGMYYREFPVMFDWVHIGEGLTVFNLQGLSDPNDRSFGDRVRRFAAFYTGEDPLAPNYDPQYKVIRSLFNGSRGPLLRKATALDWAGDPIQIEGRFKPRHGERNYAQMLEHFKDYTDIVGDHPQNLLATSLGLNAFMLTHEEKYRHWLLEYVDVWRNRMLANGNIIPSNVGLDGTIGGSAGGKWYGGVYGWGFTVHDPGSGRLVDRNTHRMALTGFGNALLASGDQRYVDAWRRQIDAINAQAKQVNGQTMVPTMHGDRGWYSYQPHKYATGALEVYYWSMDRDDLKRLPEAGSPAWPITRPYGTRTSQSAWIDYLDGRRADYPEAALRADLAGIRHQLDQIQGDTTTPDTRLADDPMTLNPCCVGSLVQLMLGGLHPGHQGSVLHCRLRYFDPLRRRAGLPEGVGALVEKLSAESTTVTLVNLDPDKDRTVIVQTGGYAEHQCVRVAYEGRRVDVNHPRFAVHLQPAAGATLMVQSRRYVNVPTMAHPWDSK